jgi:uncharacterized membrane protein
MDTSNLVVVATALLAFTSALLCGLYFVFSNFAMKALAQLPPNAGLTVMQSINRVIQNPGFLGIFLGHAVVSLALGLHAVLHLSSATSPWIIPGATLGLVGNFLVTAVFNVPLNDRLDAVQPNSAAAKEVWDQYRKRWLPWNHLRMTLLAIAAALLLVAITRT